MANDLLPPKKTKEEQTEIRRQNNLWRTFKAILLVMLALLATFGLPENSSLLPWIFRFFFGLAECALVAIFIATWLGKDPFKFPGSKILIGRKRRKAQRMENRRYRDEL